MTMKASRVIVLWLGLLVALVAVELAELTHLFTLPFQSVLADPVGLFSTLLFVTILALIGAIFLGIYISHRILSPLGFSPFEEEMLHMRGDLLELRRTVETIRDRLTGADPPSDPPPPPPPATNPQERVP